jgi:predicted transcriptional regulator
MALGSDLKVRVSPETKAALAKIAEDNGKDENISDVVRDAIREYLRRQPANRLAEEPPKKP